MKKIKYPVSRPFITTAEKKEVCKVLDSRWLTQGKYVWLAESEIKKYCGVKFAIMMNSGTSALIAAMQSLNLKKGDEVIVPAFTFPATANAVLFGGAKPVFCDIDLDTFNIDTQKLRKLITGRTKAIMPVSEFGLPADMPGIMEIARKKHLFVVEDAACALGARIGNKFIGTFGDLGIFSFHPRKIITSAEGGCVVTNNEKLAKKLLRLRNHGLYNNTFEDYGYNFRMSDLQAALLSIQLKKIKSIIRKRILLAQHYHLLLSPLEKKGLLKIPYANLPNNNLHTSFLHTYQSYVTLLLPEINREELKKALLERGIETQFGTYCVPLLNFYRKNFPAPFTAWHYAKFAYEHTLALPLYQELTFKDQGLIVKTLQRLIERTIS